MIAGFCNLPTGLFANRPVYYEIDYPPRLDFPPLLHIFVWQFPSCAPAQTQHPAAFSS